MASLVDVLVLAQRERSAAAGSVAFLAVLLQQRRDVLAERYRRRVGDSEIASHDDDGEDQEQPRKHGVC